MIRLNRCGVNFNVVETTPELNEFWIKTYPIWEPNTYNCIVPALSKDKTFVDIGAWQGPISLVAQQFSKQCICFEPDPIAYSNLVKNVELNNFTNIITENVAVSSESTLSIGHYTGLGGGVSSYLNVENSVKCDTISISDILTKYNLNSDNISVIKIDVEGYEIELINDVTLNELKNNGVKIHLSIHPFFFKDEAPYNTAIANFIGDCNKIQHGYEILINV
jgi:FkbM family methyltransferase